jgi:hypothetical protein
MQACSDARKSSRSTHCFYRWTRQRRCLGWCEDSKPDLIIGKKKAQIL